MNKDIERLRKIYEKLYKTGLDMGSGNYDPKDLIEDISIVLPLCLNILKNEIERLQKQKITISEKLQQEPIEHTILPVSGIAMAWEELNQKDDKE
jgi:hypothetical protein